MANTQLHCAAFANNLQSNIFKWQHTYLEPILSRAAELEDSKAKGNQHEFEEIINCQIVDRQALGQRPLTFVRQFLAALSYPALLTDPSIPADVKDRVNRLLDNCPGRSVDTSFIASGAYSDAAGIVVIRQDAAKYIEARDRIPTDWKNVFLSSGATDAIKALLELVSTTKDGNERAGVMIPIPQYPFYAETNEELHSYQINYYLDEEAHWGLNEAELERAIQEAAPHCQPRCLVVINPGNPTGQVLSRQDIETAIRFAKKHHLFVLADEVYQHKVFSQDKEFVSFKRVLHEMGAGYADQVELACVMSASKVYMGECGLRGGLCELVNLHPDVQAQLYKSLSAKLCSSTLGQAVMGIVVDPLRPDEPSFESHQAEVNQAMSELKEKAQMINETFNSLPGLQCNAVQGAMNGFPRILLSDKAIAAAQSKNQAPDFFYCMELLENTGICVGPGSGYGQRAGTYHFRITISQPVEKMKIALERIKQFHTAFVQRYS